MTNYAAGYADSSPDFFKGMQSGTVDTKAFLSAAMRFWATAVIDFKIRPVNIEI